MKKASGRALSWWFSVIVNDVVLENYEDPVEAFKMVRRLEEAFAGDGDLDLHLVDALGRKAWAFCEGEYQAARGRDRAEGPAAGSGSEEGWERVP